VKIKCEISEEVRDNDEGHEQECVVATCSRCDHQEESWGTSESSIRRCLVLLRENCPRDERNFYSVSEEA
jgi:hypothetical protein